MRWVEPAIRGYGIYRTLPIPIHYPYYTIEHTVSSLRLGVTVCTVSRPYLNHCSALVKIGLVCDWITVSTVHVQFLFTHSAPITPSQTGHERSNLRLDSLLRPQSLLNRFISLKHLTCAATIAKLIRNGCLNCQTKYDFALLPLTALTCKKDADHSPVSHHMSPRPRCCSRSASGAVPCCGWRTCRRLNEAMSVIQPRPF